MDATGEKDTWEALTAAEPNTNRLLMDNNVPPATTTPLSDYLVDFLIAELSGAEVKTFLYVQRHTVGRKRQSVKLTIPQIASGIPGIDRGTGLNRTSVTKALQSLQKIGMIRRALDGQLSMREILPASTQRVSADNTEGA